MPGLYPASPSEESGHPFPILNQGIFSTPAYVLDVGVNDLPVGFDIEDVTVEIVDIFGNGLSANGIKNIEKQEDIPLFSIIDADSDDAEEHEDGTVDIHSSDLELVSDGSKGKQWIGLRFTELGIPGGVHIKHAHIQFTADELNDEVTNLTLVAEDSPSAAEFSDTAENISARTKTNATVLWNPDPWNAVDAATMIQRTPDLSILLQEVVDSVGWSESSPCVIIVTGRGKRVADAYDSTPSKAPYLYVEYALSTDTDGDQLTDSWERRHFGNLDFTGSEDNDGDGLNNLQEMDRGADPNRYSILLTRGWNLISSAKSLPDNSVTPLFGNKIRTIWGLENHRFHRATSIHPQKGYWIYAATDKVIEIELP